MPPSTEQAPRPRPSWRPAPVEAAESSQRQGGSSGQFKASGPRSKKSPQGAPPTQKARTHEDASQQQEADAANRSNRRTRRGGRRRNKHTEKEWTSKDKHLAQYLELSTRFMLSVDYKADLALAASADLVLLPDGCSVLEGLQNEGETHATTVANAREALRTDPEGAPKMSKVGSSTAAAVLRLCEELAKCQVGAKCARKLNEFLDLAMPTEGEPKVTKTMIEDHIKYVRLQSCGGEEATKTKLWLGMGHAGPRTLASDSLRETILESFHNMEYEVKNGVAPPGWMKEEMSEWLEVFTKARK